EKERTLPPSAGAAGAEQAPALPDGTDTEAQRLTVIEPRSGWQLIDFREMWRCRELLYFMGWRDIKVPYRQTGVGVAWAVLPPLATMAIFTLFLGRVVGGEVKSAPYPVYLFAGLILWSFFAYGINCAGNSILGSQNLVTKVYLPRLLIPIASVAVGL